MNLLRTPDDRFVDLPDYPFAPHYVTVDGIRWHYVDEGPVGAPPVVLLHGEPTWSYLYRHMIAPLAQAGLRVLAPDLPGFGKSDKPAEPTAFSYQALVDWTRGWLDALNLTDITLFGQDWGSLIGLRLAAEQPDRFARLVIANGGLPTGDQPMPEAFYQWRHFALNARRLPVGRVIQNGTVSPLPKAVVAAYDAPFPDESYKAGARVLPALVPTSPSDPANRPNRKALLALRRWTKPFLTAFSDGDPITRGGDLLFQKHVPGAAGMPHTTIRDAGHFLQEDKGPELAQHIIDFVRLTDG